MPVISTQLHMQSATTPTPTLDHPLRLGGVVRETGPRCFFFVEGVTTGELPRELGAD